MHENKKCISFRQKPQLCPRKVYCIYSSSVFELLTHDFSSELFTISMKNFKSKKMAFQIFELFVSFWCQLKVFNMTKFGGQKSG